MNDSQFLKELQASFILSLDTKLISIETNLLKLESLNAKESIESLIRILLGDFHSLKGNASALRFKSIEIFAII